jgi:hypothetical protein
MNEFFEEQGSERAGTSFFGAEREFKVQTRLGDFVIDCCSSSRCPLSSLYKEVMLPMLSAHSSRREAIPHLIVVTGQLLLLRCFEEEAAIWNAAYPEQARKHSFPYTRASLLYQCVETLTAHPFMPSGKGMTVDNVATTLKGRMSNETKQLKGMLSRLPTSKEMKRRDSGKKSQEILIGDQAEAALDVIRFDQRKALVARVCDVNAESQLGRSFSFFCKNFF